MSKRSDQNGPKSSGFGPRTLLRIFLYHSLDPAQDLEQLREFEALFAEKGYCEETVRAARPNCLNMIVVKLNSGGLLLYCPVQVPVPVFCTQPFSFPVKRAIYVLLQTKAYGIFQCCGSEFIESG